MPGSGLPNDACTRPPPVIAALSMPRRAIVASSAPSPATRAAAGEPRGSAYTTMTATMSGAGVSARETPLSMARLPCGARQRRGSHLGCAVRAQRPPQTQTAIAVHAPPRELRPAVRTHDELLL